MSTTRRRSPRRKASSGSRGGYDPYGYFPPSRPLEAKGGIRARSQRGAFGQSWWARRWIAVLESFQLGARLERGRRYARAGQVLDIQIASGRVESGVQGSRAEPYRVAIEIQPLGRSEWQRVAESLAGETAFSAKLLAGEMPDEIERVFSAAGFTLFPARSRDLVTSCSCPDASNPCKHIAAVYYLLGEEFDRDPFLIFQLRGLARADWTALLTEVASSAAPKRAARKGRSTKALQKTRAADVRAPSPEPLPRDPAAFWGGRQAPPAAELPRPLGRPEALAALPRRLGGFPFWRGARPFLEAMDEIYAAASGAALELLATPDEGA